MKYRFGKEQRVVNQKDFNAIFTGKNKRFHGKYITLVYKKCADNENQVRAGVVSPKRIFKRAVDRNRAKRLLREAFRMLQYNLKAGDYILISRSYILRAKSQDVAEDFRKIVNKVGLYKDSDIEL
jgi:ribonuclease P protein component